MTWLRRITNLFAGTQKRAFGWTTIGGSDELSGIKVPEPYRQSVWVQRAIRKVAGPVASVPLQFSLAQRGGDQLLEDPLLAAYWESPVWENVGLPMNRYDFIEAAVGWLKLRGEFFLILDDSVLVPFPQERALYPRAMLARPDRLREVTRGNQLIGWQYTQSDLTQVALLPEQVIHVKSWNPYNPWRGLGEYDAARIATEADYAAGQFSRNLMANNGDQGVYVVAKGGLPDDAQRQQIESQLRSKREAQQRGEFRPLFLTGDIAIEDPKIKTPDVAFLDSRLANRHEIFLAFGVPPSMADKMESYSVGSASDWYLLINETCIPTAAKIAEAVERLSRLLTGRPIYAWFNFDEHPVMQSTRRERLDSALKLWSVGMPLDAISDYLDLGLPEFDGAEVGYLPFNVSPVGSELPEQSTAYDENTAPVPEEEPEEEETPVEAMLRLLRQGCPAHSAEGENLTLRDPRKLAAWRTHMARRREVLKGYASKFNRALMRARAEVMAKLERATRALETRASADSFMFNLPDFAREFLTLMRAQGATSFQTAGDQLFKELGLTTAWQAPAPEVSVYLANRENKLSRVPEEIYNEIKGELQAGIDAGDSIADMTKRIRAKFNTISRGRATTIAMTETAAVYGEARHSAMESAGVKYKIWITSGLANVRPAHAQAGRDYQQGIPLTDPFIVGGERLMFPGDPSGSPENVINCHCVAGAVPPEQALIPQNT